MRHPPFSSWRAARLALCMMSALALAACGGGGTGGSGTSTGGSGGGGGGGGSGSGGGTSTTYTIGGSISGLSASGLVLADNGGDNLSVASGASSFVFATQLQSGATYDVTVVTQPTGETCAVTSGTGTASANVSSVAVSCAVAAAQVVTFAGSTTPGSADGTGAAASFNGPSGLAVDASGNIYVADAANNEIRMITPAGVVTTLAGSTASGNVDGTGSAARFFSPEGVAVDSSGNVYVADQKNNEIRKIAPGGVVTTLAGNGTAGHADGTGAAATFNNPWGVAVDSAGDVYVADTDNNEIRMITPTGTVTTLAGSTTAGHADGTGSAASFNAPTGLIVDSGGTLFVADFNNNEIREVTSAGVVTTFAGSTAAGHADGTGTAASFYSPAGVAVDSAGTLYVTDDNNNEIRMITSAGVVTTLAGSYLNQGSSDGTGASASFKLPFGIALNASGILYIGDYGNNEVRKVTP